MKEIFIMVAFLATFLALQAWLLPRLGIST